MIQDAFVRQRARQLYWQGYPPAEISRLMGINPNTIYAWKKRDQWDETPPVQRVTQSIDARLIQLTEKQNKTGGDFKEIDLLTRANIAANEALKVRLLETEGIKEVLIAEEEHSAYVKIDSKVTNRFEIEQAIRQA